MSRSFRIALWNANGLANHSQEIKLFIHTHKIDVMLISETHFTDLSYFKIPNFSVYSTNHPDNTAHGGAAILIRKNIKHYDIPGYQYDHIQASSVVIEDWTGPLTVSAIYAPPRHNITNQQFSMFFSTLGPRFIAGGDYNAKHHMWGSRLINPRGRQLYSCMDNENLNTVSSNEPTYWPTDLRKLPDLLDFFVVKGVSNNYLSVISSLDLHSDHSPVILTLSSSVITKERICTLSNKLTDWSIFKKTLNQTINLKLPLKSEGDIDLAVEHFNSSVQKSAWVSTPFVHRKVDSCINYPVCVKRKVAERRRLRRIWQNSRQPADKNNLNRTSQQLKRMLRALRNEWFQEFTSNLTPGKDSDYSLWKVTKNIKQPKHSIPPILTSNGNWAKSNQEKSSVFAEHFEKVFKPSSNVTRPEITEFLEAPDQLSLPTAPFRPSEVKKVVMYQLKADKAPGYDLITGRVLKELTRKGIILLTLIFNAILRLQYFPTQWKLSQIVVVPKPGKPTHIAASYRPISLLPVSSKVFEKLLLSRLMPIISENEIIPDHQFGFRQKHSTVEQVHRVVDTIEQTLQTKKFCSAVFLDISQAFDKVWYPGLFFKLKSSLPCDLYNVLKSYLSNRYFQVKLDGSYTGYHKIESGVPQGSVLGPLLYVIFTSDLPISPGVNVATFADDTALLATHEDPVTASNMIQANLDEIAVWLNENKVKVNETKSTHVTFTLRRAICPPVYLNNVQLPQSDVVKYLGMHLDSHLTWHAHIWNKRQHLNLKFNKMYWLFSHNSHLTTENKLLLYKVILKPVWTYGIQLWGSASNSNIEILQRFQSKVLRKILCAPWYVTNDTIHNDTYTPKVKEEITKFSIKYHDKLENHTNSLALNLLDNSQHTYRLSRNSILDLSSRFTH